VRRLDQIRRQIGFILERNDEHVCESLRLPLLADIRAVLEADDRIDLLGQGRERVDHFLNLSGRYIVLELVHHDVTENLIPG
jgi:hypothetical protein